METASAELTRRTILDAMLEEAAYDGWTGKTLEAATRLADAEPKALTYLFPRGIPDVLDFWAGEEDRKMAEAWAALDAPPARIRDKVTWLVRRRIEQMNDHREAARRAAATLALPQHTGVAARLSWRTSGAIWRALGDSSTDGNWYSKRMTLSAVYLSTLARWFADDGETEDGKDAFAETWAFLDDRVGNVMQIEKMKARAKKLPLDPAGVASFLGRLRYRAGH